MTYVILYILLSCLALLVAGVSKQETIFEKLLFISFISNIIITMMAIFASFQGRASYIDIALIYALLSFVAMQAILRYTKLTNKSKE